MIEQFYKLADLRYNKQIKSFKIDLSKFDSKQMLK